jgi:hypothetical protein
MPKWPTDNGWSRRVLRVVRVHQVVFRVGVIAVVGTNWLRPTAAASDHHGAGGIACSICSLTVVVGNREGGDHHEDVVKRKMVCSIPEHMISLLALLLPVREVVMCLRHRLFVNSRVGAGFW